MDFANLTNQQLYKDLDMLVLDHQTFSRRQLNTKSKRIYDFCIEEKDAIFNMIEEIDKELARRGQKRFDCTRLL